MLVSYFALLLHHGIQKQREIIPGCGDFCLLDNCHFIDIIASYLVCYVKSWQVRCEFICSQGHHFRYRIFCVGPKFHITDIVWNLSLTTKTPSLVTFSGLSWKLPQTYSLFWHWNSVLYCKTICPEVLTGSYGSHCSYLCPDTSYNYCMVMSSYLSVHPSVCFSVIIWFVYAITSKVLFWFQQNLVITFFSPVSCWSLNTSHAWF